MRNFDTRFNAFSCFDWMSSFLARFSYSSIVRSREESETVTGPKAVDKAESPSESMREMSDWIDENCRNAWLYSEFILDYCEQQRSEICQGDRLRGG